MQQSNPIHSEALSTRLALRSRGICVIIPTYNNVGTIADVVSRCQQYCADVIVVNDGSNDGTELILRRLTDITLVDSDRNCGKGGALRRGFAKAKEMGFAYAITLDADGQHYPEDIPLFLAANRRYPGAIIMGQRQMQGVRRSPGSVFANYFSNFWFMVQTLHYVADTQTGYRLYPLSKLHGVSLLTSRYEAELELIVFAAWRGVPIKSQPVRVYYPSPEERVSHFRPALDFTRISILNTILCILAVVYALPLAALRLLRTMVYTLYALLFYLITCFGVMIPAAFLILALSKDDERSTWRLHRMLNIIARIVMVYHGIPGVKYSLANRYGETFTRPSVIICNHQSHLDLMTMLALTPKVVLLTNDWVWRSPFFGYVIRHAKYYPISQGIDNILPKLQKLVAQGYSVAIYPEGTRSRDCTIGRFHKGAFHIARELGLDIIPLVLYGTGRVLPKKAKSLRRGRIVLEVGERITPQEQQRHGTTMQLCRYMRHYYIDAYNRMADKLDRND